MVAPTNTQLAAQVAATLQKINEREAQYRDWLAGTATGGPNGDGRYPVTNMSGDTFLLRSLASIADTVEGPAGKSVNAQQASEAARDAAITAQNKATQDSLVSNEARIEAGQSRDLAKQYRDDAAAHAANLLVTREAAEGLRDEAVAARDEATAARDTAVEAKDASLIARADAVVARDQAEAFAASINPSAMATKADLSEEIARIVGQVPETMNALDELAAALGNDPNFATTVTNQIAGKAALIHVHGIADVTGLQSALDGKQPVGSYATFTHAHALADVTGLQAALNGKSDLSHTHEYIGRWTNAWLLSTDGRNRFYFGDNGRTYFGSANGFEFRSPTDVNIAEISNQGYMTLSSADGPTLTLRHTGGAKTAYIHNNGNRLYFLSGNPGAGHGGWVTVNGAWPLEIDLNNNNMYSGGSITAQGDVTAFSDARLKSNIRTLEGALDLIRRLRGVRYSKDDRESLGVIAQEVQEVLPELVHESPEGMLSVAYANIVGVLIEALKELADKVDRR